MEGVSRNGVGNFRFVKPSTKGTVIVVCFFILPTPRTVLKHEITTSIMSISWATRPSVGKLAEHHSLYQAFQYNPIQKIKGSNNPQGDQPAVEIPF